MHIYQCHTKRLGLCGVVGVGGDLINDSPAPLGAGLGEPGSDSRIKIDRNQERSFRSDECQSAAHFGTHGGSLVLDSIQFMTHAQTRAPVARGCVRAYYAQRHFGRATKRRRRFGLELNNDAPTEKAQVKSQKSHVRRPPCLSQSNRPISIDSLINIHYPPLIAQQAAAAGTHLSGGRACVLLIDRSGNGGGC